MPYIFNGNLREQIIYPFTEKSIQKKEKYFNSIPSDSEITKCLELSNIKYIMDRSENLMNKKIDWNKELSIGNYFLKFFFIKFN
jgi:ABC-type uncharacterized transport system fused permease/ATPase subunit